MAAAFSEPVAAYGTGREAIEPWMAVVADNDLTVLDRLGSAHPLTVDGWGDFCRKSQKMGRILRVRPFSVPGMGNNLAV